ncbi:MAG: hypothetical protein KJ958_09450 [Gammaproteobacteria bacterium]|nr:hypothetical protein [Gammaproteobacteria bacterium]MBU1979378.1 hypothetical protein [Gammaproteobacteria bacterium]
MATAKMSNNSFITWLRRAELGLQKGGARSLPRAARLFYEFSSLLAQFA